MMVSYGGGHIPMALSLIRALRKSNPDVQIDLLALTTAYAEAIRAGERAWRYLDWVHLVDESFVATWGDRLAPELPHPSISNAETRAYYGVNFWDMVEQHGFQEASALFQEKGRQAFLPLFFFRRLIGHIKPDVVVATVSPRSEEAALKVAIELGIPTLSMTDLFLRSFDPYCFRTVYADRVTVIDHHVKEVLARAGVPEQALTVTGNPAFDGLLSTALRQQALDFRTRLGWNQKTVVLWAGHADYVAGDGGDRPSVDYPVAVESCLRKWLEASSERALIIRYHPNEIHLFPNGTEHPRVFKSPQGQAVHEAVMAADVVVVQRSTVGLEAAIAGKPVVAMINSPLCVRDRFNYEEYGIAYASPTVEDLPSVIELALKRGCAAPELAARGPAAPVIADLVLQLALKNILE